MNKQVQIHHHRSRKKFESFCVKNNIRFYFDGYTCGMYDPVYKVNWYANFEKCPVEVWLNITHLRTKSTSCGLKLNAVNLLRIC